MKRKCTRALAGALAFVAALLLFSGCGANHTTAFERLSRLKDAGLLPHGRYYNSEAEKWEEGYITTDTAEKLYRFDGVSELHHAERYAVFVSDRFGRICEIGIFDAPDRVSANELLVMCERRIALLSRYAENGLNERILLCGNSVMYIAGLDEESAERVCALLR